MLTGSRHSVRHRSLSELNWNAPASPSVPARITPEWALSHAQWSTVKWTLRSKISAASPNPAHTARYDRANATLAGVGFGARALTTATSLTIRTVVGSIIAPTITVQMSRNAAILVTHGSVLCSMMWSWFASFAPPSTVSMTVVVQQSPATVHNSAAGSRTAAPSRCTLRVVISGLEPEGALK